MADAFLSGLAAALTVLAYLAGAALPALAVLLVVLAARRTPRLTAPLRTVWWRLRSRRVRRRTRRQARRQHKDSQRHDS